jgi:hypothetical protein
LYTLPLRSPIRASALYALRSERPQPGTTITDSTRTTGRMERTPFIIPPSSLLPKAIVSRVAPSVGLSKVLK